MKVAVLVTGGFEKIEMTEPRKAIDEAGMRIRIVALKGGDVRGRSFME